MSLRNLFVVPFAVFSLAVLVGCGSNNGPASNPQGFTTGSLSGVYVFSTQGSDSQDGDLLAIAGAFTADGSGHVTANMGTIDIIDPTEGSALGQTVTGGSYTINTDGRGQVQLNTAAGNFVFGFVLAASSSGVSPHGLISEFDGFGSGSGTLDLQTSVPTLAQLGGSYAFNLSGSIGGNISAATGSVTLDTTGDITGGIQDVNSSGITFSGQSIITGPAVIAPTATTPGSILVSTSSFGETFDFFPVDATHLKLIETDGAQFLVGDAFTQTGSSIPNSAMVFTMSGGTLNLGPIALGGLTTSDGSGDFSNGLEDVNNAGTISPAQLAFSGTAAGPAGVGGRVQVNLAGSFVPATTWVVYPSSGGLLMLEMDAFNVTQGVGYAQTATTFTTGTSAGYGMNLTGFNLFEGFGIDDIAQFNASTSSSNNMTGVLSENDEGVNFAGPLNLTGTFTPDSPATGRGSILVPSLGTPLGGLSLEYYVVNSTTALMIEGDQDQVSVGVFEGQTAGSGDRKSVV